MFGYDWKIIKTKEKDGEFYFKDHTIKVGTFYGEEEEIFIHEILEAILVQNHFRFYGQEGSMEYQFVFNHTGLCKIHRELFKVLKDNKLI